MTEEHNPDVYVGNTRRIAARGLIPGHEGSWVKVGEQRGELDRFYHRNDGYTVTDLAVKHLTEIEIRA